MATTIVASGTTATDLTIANGGTLTVQTGGTVISADILSGGLGDFAGMDTGTTIALGGVAEIEATGTSTGDIVFGTLELFATSGTAKNVTVENTGTLALNANAPVTNLVLSGGTVLLESKKSNISGTISFAGAGTLIESAVISSGYGALGTITGFGANDVIELTSAAVGTGAAVTSATSGTNTVVTVTSGSAVETFTFAGTGLSFEASTITGGGEIITLGTSSTSSNITTVASGQSVAGVTVTSGQALDVLAGGTASNVVLSGGVLELASANSTLSGGVSFAGAATLKEDGLVSPTALITGFGTNDVIDLATIGSGAIITSSTIGGNTVLTISGGSGEGGADVSVTMAGTGNIYALGKDAGGTGETLTEIPLLTSFAAGDIVIGMVGDVDDSGDYGDNQAAPVALEEIDPTTGKIIGEMLMPQTTSVVNGVVENIFSGEYGSSSEGILELSGDGESLVIAGYGINAAAYNAAEVAGGVNTYGTAALAQTTSLEGGAFTPVTRVIADIGYNGTIDTSTALLNVFNGNNPRSVATVDGKVFYIAGQGQSGDTTQGVFVVNDGSSVASALYTSTDARDVEIYNGNVYVSVNSKQDGDVATVDEFSGEPTTTSTPVAPTALPGIGNSVVLTAATENSVNASAVGTAVALSPEQYFFANATTLYIADGGDPKGGGLGDGGLQKWVLNTGTGQWTLAYTLSAGLNQVADTGSAGTTGLIGLTGVLHADDTVTFYATNSTLGDLDQTYLYTITDTVSATTPAVGASFTVVTTAQADTNIRGIAEAPSAPTNTIVSAGQTSAGLTISTGSTLTVQAGGSITGAVINAGGTALVSGSDSASLIAVGGTETVYGSATGDAVDGTQIVSGGVSNETVNYGATMEVMAGGTASNITTEVNGDVVVSGSVSTLTLSGGVVALAAAGASVAGVTFAGAATVAELIGGTSINGIIAGFAAGDAIDLTQVGTAAVLTSAVVGGNTVETVTSGGVSQSFTLAGTYASGAITLAKDSSGGVEVTIVSSGGGGGTTSSGSNAVTVSSGQTSAGLTVSNGGTLTVLSGGTVTSPIVLSGGIAKIAGTDTGAVVSAGGTLQLSAGAIENNGTILTGGTELLLGSATVTGGQIYGLQEVVSAGNSTSGATLSNETIFNGGEVEFLLKGYTLQNSTVMSGGEFYINGNATGRNLTLAGGTIQLDSSKANLMGTLDFESGTLDLSSVISSVSAGSAFGDLATITHFGAGDVIEFTAAGITAFKETSSTAGTLTTVTLSVTSGSSTQVSDFTFANVGDLSVVTLANGVIELLADTPLSGGTEIVSSGGVVSNTTVTNGGTLVVSGGTESGGVISFGGTEIIGAGGTASGTTVINGGTQVVTNGGTVTGAFIEQDSTQIISSGGVAIGTTVGDPSVETIALGGTAFDTTVTTGGELDVYGSVTGTTIDAGGEEIVFSGGTAAGNLINTGGTLVLDGGTVTDITLAAGGTLINEGFTFDAGMTGTITGGELVVSDGGTTLFSLQLDGDYSGETVLVTAAADGKVELTLCFYPGTHIATPQGDTVVEALRPGDMVLTANGPLPVRWIGQSHIATRFADKRSLPVRITQGALGGGLPVRDLLLSPDHAVFIGGILAQAGALVNDDTIIREYDVPAQFTYYHVELATHELLLAEGVQAESFVDNVDRMHFHNWDERTAPDLPISEMPYARAKSQRQLPPALRRMLAASKRA